MDATFRCPCDAAQKLGRKALNLHIVGLADNVLYRMIVLLEDPSDPIDKVTGRRKLYGIIPCEKSCIPPPQGILPEPPHA